MAGMRAWSGGRKILAERRTPSRMGMGTCSSVTMGRCGAPQAAPQASARYQTRTAVASIAIRSPPPGGSIEYTRRPAGRWYPPPLASMLAETCERAANRIRTRRAAGAGGAEDGFAYAQESDGEAGGSPGGGATQVDAGIGGGGGQPELAF